MSSQRLPILFLFHPFQAGVLLSPSAHGQHLSDPDEDVDSVQENPNGVVDGVKFLGGVLGMVLGPSKKKKKGSIKFTILPKIREMMSCHKLTVK